MTIFLTIKHSSFVEKKLSELAGIRTHDLPLEATYYYSEIGISIEAFTYFYNIGYSQLLPLKPIVVNGARKIRFAPQKSK